VFLPLLWLCVSQEQAVRAALSGLHIDQAASALQSGGNMEGKEVRFGISATGLFATATTSVSCGAVNAMHDSFSPLGGMVPLWLIQIGEVIFGGVGAGMYGILMFAVIAVFVAGLMVGRTPEYIGKKIEAREMKMASIAVLVPGGDDSHLHGDRRRDRGRQEGRPQPRPARVQRSALRVLIGGRKQRERLRGAQRQHALLQHHTGHRDVLRTLLDQGPRPRSRGCAGSEEARAGWRWHSAHAHPSLRCAARGDDRSSSAPSRSFRRSRSAPSSSTSSRSPEGARHES
jgi:hypothetical protein